MERCSINDSIVWIDTVKAVCMICVYLIHSQVYYGIGDTDFGWMLIPFYVTAFFFVSGYLFFRKYLNTNALYGGGISILYRIVIPTILFSTILYLPKTLFHGENMNVKRMLFNVLGGIGFWFTSALVVAQLSLLLMMKIKRNAIWLYIILSLVLFVIGLYLNLQRTSADASSFFPWFYMTGFEYTLVMGIGGFYWKYEMAIDRYIKYLLPVMLVLYIYLMYDDWNSHEMLFMGLGGFVNFKGILCIICSIALIIALSKKIPYIAFFKFVSRNSIVFYFFSGVFPAAIGTMAKRLLPNSNYGITLIVAMIAVVCGAVTTWIITTYIPFMTDIRKLHVKRREN